MSFYSEQLTGYLSQLDIKADCVLDVGGSQDPVLNRTNSWVVKDYNVMDLEKPHIVKVAPNIIADINYKLEGIRLSKYDIVFCLEVMEYVFNPVVAIKNLCNLLKKDGTLYISFPFLYPLHKPIKDDCLRYTYFGATKLLTKAGFEVDNVEYRVAKDPVKLLEFYKSDGMHIGGDADVTGFIFKCKKL